MQISKIVLNISLVVLLLLLGLSFILGINFENRFIKDKDNDKFEWFIASQNKYYSINKLNYQLTRVFTPYEDALIKYIDSPSQQNRETWLSISREYDQNLEKASTAYGLNVKRWVDLFLAWEHRIKEDMLSSPQAVKSSDWHLILLMYHSNLQKEINVSKNDFRLDVAEKALYGNFVIQKAAPKIQEQVNQLYVEKLQFLVPQAAEDLRNRKGMTACAGPSKFLTQKGMAAWIATLQYQTRYCAFMTSSKTKSLSLCNAVRSTINNEQKEFQNKMLALCVIVENRLKEEEDNSLKIYGNLSYDDYFNKYVAPLIPRYISALKINAHSNNSNTVFHACDPKELPVVNFRDPTVDAQVAAYAYTGPIVCRDSLLS